MQKSTIFCLAAGMVRLVLRRKAAKVGSARDNEGIMMRAFLGAVLAASAAPAAAAAGYDITEKSVAQLQADMASGRVTSEQIVRAYIARIDAVDRNGPSLNSVIAINPAAVKAARAADAARKEGKVKGLLFGVPVLIKDNIETRDEMATTAGSLALKDNITRRDSPSIARLRAAGAIILGKTNLSEWANIRSSQSISGWSAIGGLVKNPYVLDRNACGSSSGSGAAVAASLAAAAIGTETDGSLVCPGSINGVVSLKPTVGLVSRTYVVPISHSQDTPGPMGRTVADVAALLTAMAGSDPKDMATAQASKRKTDYLAALKGASLKGVRIGVLHSAATPPNELDGVFGRAIAAMKKRGAVIVPLKYTPPDFGVVGNAELTVLACEMKVDIEAYLASTPPSVKTRTLKDVMAFNIANKREMALFGQELFVQIDRAKGLSDPDYLKAAALLRKTARTEGLDKMLNGNKIDAMVMPTEGPAWRIDVVRGDNTSGTSSFLPAVAGYPHLTVPMGYVGGLPVGISFVGRAWSEARLLAIGAAFESATRARHAPTFIPSLESTAVAASAFRPMKRASGARSGDTL
jgi:amidase